MNLKEFVSKLNNEIMSYQTGVRKERASLLVWFLLNYFRLDDDTAFDSVCDSDNDKGIDGIFIDDQTEEVYVLQSKYSPYPGNHQGDKDIRDFKGARVWFDSPENIKLLDSSTASKELKSLVIKTDVFEKIASGYSLIMVFVTNKRFNQEATEYLQILGDEIDAWDLDRLYDCQVPILYTNDK